MSDIRKILAEILIMCMQNTDDESERVLMLQRYVQQHGPVPRGYRAKVMACLKDERVTSTEGDG